MAPKRTSRGVAPIDGVNEIDFQNNKKDVVTKVTSETNTRKAANNHASNGLDSSKKNGNRPVTSVTTFKVDADGLHCLSGDSQRWLASYMQVLAQCHGENGTGWGVLIEYKDRLNAKHEVVVPFALTLNELRKCLADRGIRIARGDGTIALISQYLDVPISNTIRLVNECGWHGRGNSFVMPGITLGDQSYRLEGDVQEPMLTSGELTEWKEKVGKYCIGNSRLILAASLAFAGPVLGILKLEPFGVHFQGTSSEGKSTIGVYLVGSIWAEPESFRVTWRTTVNGLEGKAAERTHMLLPLDELKQIDPEEAVKAIYTIAGGTGKGRANTDGRARKILRWSVPFVSTGEISLADHVSSGGQRYHAGLDVRLIQLPADAGKGYGIFDSLHEFESGEDFSKTLTLNCKNFFGTPGRAMVRKLIENKNTLEASFEIYQKQFRSEINGVKIGRQAQRVAGHLSLIAAAGELATEYGVTGWPPGEALRAANRCFSDWLESRATPGELEDQQILSRIRQFLETYGDSRFAKADEVLNSEEFANETDSKAAQRAGIAITKPGGQREWRIFPGMFNTELCAGFDVKRVKRLLIEKGWMLVDDRRLDKSVRIPGLAKATRMIVLTSKVFEDDLLPP